MPLPFIAGALVGAAAVAVFNKRAAIKNFDADKFAAKAGSAVENSIKKVASVGKCASKKCKKNDN